LNAFNALNIAQSDYKTGTAIVNDSAVSAAKQIQIMSIPIMNPLLSKLNPKSLRGAVYLTFFLNSNPVAASANAGVLRLISANLRFVTSSNPDTDSTILGLYNVRPAYLPFTYANQITFTNQTLTAGSQSDFILSSLIGKCAGVAISIIPQASYNTNTANGNLNFVSLSGTDATKEKGSFDLLNSSRVTILGSGAVTERFSRCQNMLLYGGGSLSIYQPILWILFANHPASQFSSGNIDGYQEFDGTQILRLTPGTLFTLL
jgi:hypothetical protein